MQTCISHGRGRVVPPSTSGPEAGGFLWLCTLSSLGAQRYFLLQFPCPEAGRCNRSHCTPHTPSSPAGPAAGPGAGAVNSMGSLHGVRARTQGDACWQPGWSLPLAASSSKPFEDDVDNTLRVSPAVACAPPLAAAAPGCGMLPAASDVLMVCAPPQFRQLIHPPTGWICCESQAEAQCGAHAVAARVNIYQ